MRTISRDPFARTETVRMNWSVTSTQLCDWCGTKRQSKSGNPYLYRYATETDGGSRHWHRGLFCCKSCHDSFNS